MRTAMEGSAGGTMASQSRRRQNGQGMIHGRASRAGRHLLGSSTRTLFAGSGPLLPVPLLLAVWGGASSLQVRLVSVSRVLFPLPTPALPPALVSSLSLPPPPSFLPTKHSPPSTRLTKLQSTLPQLELPQQCLSTLISGMLTTLSLGYCPFFAPREANRCSSSPPLAVAHLERSPL